MNLKNKPLAAAAAGMPPAAVSKEAGAATAVDLPVEPVPGVVLEPLLADIAEARVLLRCSRSHIYELLKEGVLERRKLGGATRVTMASIRKVAGLRT